MEKELELGKSSKPIFKKHLMSKESLYNDAKRLEAELIQIVKDDPEISASAANALLASDCVIRSLVLCPMNILQVKHINVLS